MKSIDIKKIDIRASSFCHPTEEGLDGTDETYAWSACPRSGCPGDEACKFSRQEEIIESLSRPNSNPVEYQIENRGYSFEFLANWSDWYRNMESERCSCQPHNLITLTGMKDITEGRCLLNALTGGSVLTRNGGVHKL